MRKTKAMIRPGWAVGGGALHVTIDLEIPVNSSEQSIRAVTDKIKCLRYNLKWMVDHLVNWRAWDFSYSISLFANSLQQLGKAILKNQHHTDSIKHARRALCASKQLYQVDTYLLSSDTALSKSQTRYSHKSVDLPSGNTLWKPIYHYDNAMNMPRDEYQFKQLDIIYKRIEAAKEKNWGDAWDYIKKYIRHWWD